MPEEIQKRHENYINEHITTCIGNFESLDFTGANINVISEPQTTVTYTDENTVFLTKINIDVQLESGQSTTIETYYSEIPIPFKQVYQKTPFLRELVDTAKEMEGVVRSAGTHAAGVIVTDKPLTEYVPIHRPTGSSTTDSPIKTVS